jgi:hypothetical protein
MNKLGQAVWRARLVCGLVGLAFCSTVSGPAFGFSGSRILERVSPSFKGGYGVGTLRMVSGDGERVAFESLGVFAGVQWDSTLNMYLAQRAEDAGWATSSLQPPPIGQVNSFSSGLEYVFASAGLDKTSEEAPSTNIVYTLHRVDLPNIPENWEIFGGLEPLSTDGEQFSGASVGGSGDLCHLIIGFTDPQALLPAADKTLGEIYDMSRGCDGSEPGLRLVSLDGAGNVINPDCGVELGTGLKYAATDGGDRQGSSFNSISADGSMIFFTTSMEKKGNCDAHQVFVRLDGERTVEISKPLGESCIEVPCPGASSRPDSNFNGASEDGTHVYFTSNAQLVEGDKDGGNDLYLADIGCGEGEAGCGIAERRVVSLVQVSHDPVAGQLAGVVGVLSISREGSRAYFVAHGVLSEGSNAEGRTPVNGADNLYVYDAQTGRTAFITDLCSGPSLSGSVEDLSCPVDLSEGEGVLARNDRELWGVDQQVKSTPDGRVLVFSSYGQLTEDDADSSRDIYRYDDASELLKRVSLSEDGYDANGNDAFDDTIALDGINAGHGAAERLELSSRVVSDDGNRIVFSTPGPLSSRAVNGLTNIYEWSREGEGEGAVSMLSGGASVSDDESPTISPSGRDVFFVTAGGLVNDDGDGLRDIYDARIGGGFPQSPDPREPCAGDACQGPLTNPEPLLVAGSLVQEAGENFSPPKKKKTAPKKKTSKKVKSGRHRGAGTGRNHRRAKRATQGRKGKGQ